MVFDRRNGIYRCIVIAAFGLALVGADKGQIAPQGVGDAQTATQGNASNKVAKPAPQAVAAPEAQETEPRDTGCTEGKDRRESDLCAQWKAADAAKSAANAAWWLGTFGLIIGGATLGAAIMAAYYAKDAANVGQRALSAEYRPWIHIERLENIQISRRDNTGISEGRFDVFLKNHGRKPARFTTEALLSGKIVKPERPTTIALPKKIEQSAEMIMPGEEVSRRICVDWTDIGVPPTRVYIAIFYEKDTDTDICMFEAIYWIGSEINAGQVNSLAFNIFGDASGKALRTWSNAT